MYRLGWDDRNGGNISYMLDKKEVAEYLSLDSVSRTIPTHSHPTNTLAMNYAHELDEKTYTHLGKTMDEAFGVDYRKDFLNL